MVRLLILQTYHFINEQNETAFEFKYINSSCKDVHSINQPKKG